LGKEKRKTLAGKARARNKASSSLSIPDSNFHYYSKKTP
jgi:hypothetical protein